MNTEHVRRLRALLGELLVLPPHKRGPWLDELRARDPQLAQEVEHLARAAEDDDPRFEPLFPSRPVRFAAFEAGARLGPFRLVERLGEGGMGEVWLAERADGAYTQQVAIKSPHAGAEAPQALERFEHERRLLAALEHPGIARVVDGGATDEGRPWLAMEYVEGRPIDVFVTERQLDLRERVVLVRDIARTLESAHRRLIVHRDLKPSNVLVRPDGRIALLDFGIGAVLGAVVDPLANRLGTPRYSSPEQAAGSDPTTATDIFALGTLARELWSRADVQLDDDLDAILVAATRVDASARMSSAALFAAELDRWLAKRPIESRPASLAHRARLFARRQPALTFVALSAAIGLSAAALLVLRSLREEQRARSAAEQAEQTALRRLEDVHGLVTALVGGVHDRVSGLAGAVPVREYLLDVAERQLVVLEEEAARAPASHPRTTRLAVEIHLRLAEVLGARSYGSRGDLPRATEHVQRALARIDAHAEHEPQSGLEGPRLRAWMLFGDLARASGALDEAESRYTMVLSAIDGASSPRSVAVDDRERLRAAALLQRGRARFTHGDCEAGLYDVHAAQSAYVALLERSGGVLPSTVGQARDVALAHAEVGRAEAQLGRSRAALEGWRAAETLLFELERAAPSDAQLRWDRIELDAELATTLAELGEFDAAEVKLVASLEGAQRLVQSDVGNVLAVRLERTVHIRSARIATLRGRLPQAQQHYRAAAELAQRDTPEDRQAILELAECLVMDAELERRSGAVAGLAARFSEGLGLLPSGDAALASGDHAAGNVRTVALIGLGNLLAAEGDQQAAVAALRGARQEVQAWSRVFGALQWPLRSEGALEYALGCSHEALAADASDPMQRATELAAALGAFRAGLGVARRLEQEGRLQSHEAGIVGYFEADVARVEAALAGR